MYTFFAKFICFQFKISLNMCVLRNSFNSKHELNICLYFLFIIFNVFGFKYLVHLVFVLDYLNYPLPELLKLQL